MGASLRQTAGRLFLQLACVCACSTYTLSAEPNVSMVLCREELTVGRQHELAEQLRTITGWPDLHFDAEGALRFGNSAPHGGSQKARELLASAQQGHNLFVIEDASGRHDVVFGRVVEAKLKDSGPPAFIVQLDFADFSQVIGDKEALAAFNAGWVTLHELYHVTSGAPDTDNKDETGECEALINEMRRECRLAVRAEYHFHFFPGHDRVEFKTRYVRLAFEKQNLSTNKKRRVWLMWDAAFVGGLPSGQALTKAGLR
jgi:hypothetical protein